MRHILFVRPSMNIDRLYLDESICFLFFAAGDVAHGRRDSGDPEVYPGARVPQVLQQGCGAQVPQASAVRRAVPEHVRDGLPGTWY